MNNNIDNLQSGEVVMGRRSALKVIAMAVVAGISSACSRLKTTLPTPTDSVSTQVGTVEPATQVLTATVTPTEAPTATPTEVVPTPEPLAIPEVEDSLVFSYRTITQIVKNEPGSFGPETIIIDQDSRLPIPIGKIDPETANPRVLEALSKWEELYGICGVVLSVDKDDSVPNIWYITLRTKTPNRTPFIVNARFDNKVSFDPRNQDFDPVGDQDEDSITLHGINSVFSPDKIVTPTGAVIGPGTIIAFPIENPTAASNDPIGIAFQINAMANGVEDGTPSKIFDQIDNGIIDPENAFLHTLAHEIIIYIQKDRLLNRS
ncbi:hypothetical protein JW796_02310 [Candidatus Dojkabacteria bacterium]|nr:hypothetical protein [Candidatus Dojkabacteria bacterium]